MRVVLLSAIALFLAVLTIALPDRPIGPASADDSLEGAIQRVEKETGFQVVCSEETRRVVQGAYALRSSTTTQGNADGTIRSAADNLGQMFGLDWKFGPQDKTITLELPWCVADPRPAAKLLRAIWNPEAVSKMGAQVLNPGAPVLPRNVDADVVWQQTFNALLSKEGNFERAWKVRQGAGLQNGLRFPNAPPDFVAAPVLEAELNDGQGGQYFGIFFHQNSGIARPEWSVSHYLFRADGTLVGAGLAITGGEYAWLDCKVEDAPAAQPANVPEFLVRLEWSERDKRPQFLLTNVEVKSTAGVAVGRFNNLGVALPLFP